MARHLQWRQCVFARFVESALDTPIPAAASYEASFALPAGVLEQARQYVGLDCKDQCDERIWDQGCQEEANA
jgi:DtxR family Mn-dependent transcriptional regulator